MGSYSSEESELAIGVYCNMEYKLLTQSDTGAFLELLELFEVVFEMEPFVRPDETYLRALLVSENFFSIVAAKDGRVVGGLTVYVLKQYFSKKPLAYIMDLAVMTQFQRQGIGSQLIDLTRRHCRELGCEELFVQADRVDDYALDFYRKTNPSTEEDVLHYTYRL